MEFTLSERVIRGLFEQNCMPIPSEGMVLFGLRGCLPLNYDMTGFADKHQVRLVEHDHNNCRCTLGQWLPAEKKIAIFPGSTVPHNKYIVGGIGNGGKGCNEMMTGLMTYEKGYHQASEGSPYGHSALRILGDHPFRRTSNDGDYDPLDPYYFGCPGDNLHAAYTTSISSGSFGSAGCQVVLGQPTCAARGNAAAVGPWSAFKNSAYAMSQNRFPYLLVNGYEAARIAALESGRVPARIRFGSRGQLVRDVQTALKSRGFYNSEVDGVFAKDMFLAVMRYQESTFGPGEDDGIVGPTTAQALGVTWPEIELGNGGVVNPTHKVESTWVLETEGAVYLMVGGTKEYLRKIELLSSDGNGARKNNDLVSLASWLAKGEFPVPSSWIRDIDAEAPKAFQLQS